MRDEQQLENDQLQSAAGKEEGINLYAIFFKYLAYWPWFVACVLVCLIGCYIYLRYQAPVYNISSAVLIKEDDKRNSASSVTSPLAAMQDLQVLVIDSVYSSADRPGAVVEQFPLPRARVKNSRVIQLTTNALNPEQIPFPELRNLAFRQAIQQLNSIGLDVRHIQFAPSPFRNLVLDYKLGDSLLQPGNLVTKGQAIDLILGAGENGDQVYLPRLIGLTVSEARRQTLLAYLNIGEVIPDATVTSRTDLASARVYEQLPRYINKRTLTQGDTLVLRVTLDEQKIQLADSLLNAQHQ